MTEFINDQLAELGSEPIVYQLVSDDDGHWYVIQTEDEENFHQWVEDTVNGNDSEYDFSDCAVGGSPTLVKFPAYWIE